MNNYLLITVLGENRIGLVSELTKAVLDCGCNIVDCRVSVLGGECTAALLLCGNWNTLAKLEAQLKKLEQSLNVTILSRRNSTESEHSVSDSVLPYSIEVIALDQSGIVYRLCHFFASRSIHVEELVSRAYSAPHTKTPMTAVNMIIAVPSAASIALLRDEFMDLCDELNWDAVMEPVKA